MVKLPFEQTSQPQMRKLRKILIYRYGQLGDTIVALPALWAVRRAFPEACLTYLRSDHPGRGYVPAEEVLPRKGLIDDWLTYTLASSTDFRSMFRLWKILRARQFDVLVYLAPGGRPRSSIWRDLLFFRTAGIRHIIGHKGFRVFPRRIQGQLMPTLENEADHLLQRLALSQISVPAKNRGEMDFALTSEERLAGEEWLRTHVPGFPNSSSLVGIGLGGKLPIQLWPEDRFAELGRRLISEMSLFPIIIGGPAEVPLAQRILKKWGTGACTAGQLGIRTTAAVLERCQLFVGNDTGAMHMAAAVHTPCVAIFSARDWPGKWYPYGGNHVILRRSVPCEGCFLSECTKEDLRCLKEIRVEDAFQACQTVLRGQFG